MKTKITLLAYALLCGADLTFAQPGTLDNTFGTDGKVTTLVGTTGNHCHAYATAIQPNGKIVVAGDFLTSSNYYDFLVVRYNNNGTLDNTFAGNGKASVDFGTDAFAYAIAIQHDGKIVVAGYSGSDGAVVRLTKNGTLDNSFNSGGKLFVDFGGNDIIYSIAIQSDGRIVVAGESDKNNIRVGVARINATDGHFDGGFGPAGTGKVVTVVGGSSAANSVAIQTDGRIVVAGNAINGSNGNFLVLRYNSNGTLDNTFGNNGESTVDFGGYDFGKSVAIQEDGRIVVAGVSSLTLQNYIAVTKLGPLGKRIGDFGVSGRVTTVIGFNDGAKGSSVAIQSNGKIVVAGDAADGTPNFDFALVRYNTNGTLDNSFGTNGIVTTGFGHADYGQAVAIQQDGKIVVAGFSETTIGNAGDVIVLARYNGDPVSLTASTDNISAATDKKIPNSSPIKMFPNPAKNVLSIDGMDASSTKTISIVDMHGKIVQTTTTANSEHTWNIASLPAGTYYLIIDDRKKKMSLKFVKE